MAERDDCARYPPTQYLRAEKEFGESPGFYGPDFRDGALKANPRVEQIEKDDLISAMRNATRQTKKGNYFENKASQRASLLALIDPNAVRAAAPDCARLFESILAELETGG